MSDLYRAPVYTEFGDGQLTISDSDGSPDLINGSVDLPLTVEQGNARSAGDEYETYTYGSFVELTLADPTRELFDRFERFFDETRYDVILDLPGFGIWRGKLRNDLIAGPTNEGAEAPTVTVTAYDRLGKLRKIPVRSPIQLKDFRTVLTELFWEANAQVPIFVGIDAEFEDITGTFQDVSAIAPYSRETTGFSANIKRGSDGEYYDFSFKNLRAALDKLARGLNCHAFYDPVGEHWVFVHRSALGGSISGYRTDANGIGNASWESYTYSFDTKSPSRRDTEHTRDAFTPVRPLDEYVIAPQNPRSAAHGPGPNGNEDEGDRVDASRTGGVNKDPFCRWSEQGSDNPLFWKTQSGPNTAFVGSPNASKPTGIKLPSGSSNEEELRSIVDLKIDTTGLRYRRNLEVFEYESTSNLEIRIVENYADGDTYDNGWVLLGVAGVLDKDFEFDKKLENLELWFRGYGYWVWSYFVVLRPQSLTGKAFEETFKDEYSRFRSTPPRRKVRDPDVDFLIDLSGDLTPVKTVRSKRKNKTYDRTSYYRYNDRTDLEGEGLYAAEVPVYEPVTLGQKVKLKIPQKTDTPTFIPSNGRQLRINGSGAYTTVLNDVEVQ